MVSFILLLAPSLHRDRPGLRKSRPFPCGVLCYGKEADSWIDIAFPGMEHKVAPINIMEAIFLFILMGILLWMGLSKKDKWGFQYI